jgi:hypothetical protein
MGGGWHDMCSFIYTFLSGVAEVTHSGIGFPLYLYPGSFTNCVNNRPWLALGTRRLWLSFPAGLRITGHCVKLSAQVLWLQSLFGHSPFQNMEIRACFLVQQQNPKAFIILLSPHYDFTCSSDLFPLRN